MVNRDEREIDTSKLSEVLGSVTGTETPREIAEKADKVVGIYRGEIDESALRQISEKGAQLPREFLGHMFEYFVGHLDHTEGHSSGTWKVTQLMKDGDDPSMQNFLEECFVGWYQNEFSPMIPKRFEELLSNSDKLRQKLEEAKYSAQERKVNMLVNSEIPRVNFLIPIVTDSEYADNLRQIAGESVIETYLTGGKTEEVPYAGSRKEFENPEVPLHKLSKNQDAPLEVRLKAGEEFIRIYSEGNWYNHLHSAGNEEELPIEIRQTALQKAEEAKKKVLESAIDDSSASRRKKELEQLAGHFDKYNFGVSGKIWEDEDSTAILYCREGAILGQHIKYMQGVYAFDGEKELTIVHPVDTRNNDESRECVNFERLGEGEYQATLRRLKSKEEKEFSIDFN